MEKKIVQNTKHTLRFVETVSGKPLMPVVTHTQSGIEVVKSSSYNSFKNRDELNKFVRAQQVLAKHFSKEDAYATALKGFEVERSVIYSSREKI